MELKILKIVENKLSRAKKQSDFKIKNHCLDYELVKVICQHPESHPPAMLEMMKSELNLDRINRSEFSVVDELRKSRLDSPSRRVKWSRIVKKTGERLSCFMQVNRNDYDEIYDQIKRVVFTDSFTPMIGPKAILMFFCFYCQADLAYYKPLGELVRVGSFTMLKEHLHDLIDLIASEKGLKKRRSRRDKFVGQVADTQDLIQTSLKPISSPQNEIVDANETFRRENYDLRSALEIAEQQLEGLQDEIDQIRQEAMDDAFVSFFQEMNSIRFGNLLDTFAMTERMIKELKKENYEIPEKIALIPGIVRMFARFLKTKNVVPIKEIGEKQDINLADSEQYEYAGSDFENDVQKKDIVFKSTGWSYKDHLISAPKAEEIKI